VEDCKELLKLMGVPFVSAPCEAEAQCAELVKDLFLIIGSFSAKSTQVYKNEN